MNIPDVIDIYFDSASKLDVNTTSQYSCYENVFCLDIYLSANEAKSSSHERLL